MIKIITDSSSNVPELPNRNYSSVPLKIIVDGNEYVDDRKINIDNLINALKKGRKTATSCPNVSDWLDAFEGNDEIRILLIIDNKNDKKMNDIILYRFEIFCNNYLEDIENKKRNIYQRLLHLSKNYLKEVIKFYYGESERKDIKLKNLCNIYCIAFIKRYLNYFVDILSDNDKYQHLTQGEDIMQLLFHKNHKAIKRIDTLKYYVLKLLYINKFNKNWDKFATYFYDKNNNFKFDNYPCFRDIKFNNEYKNNESLPILLLMDNQYKEIL